MALGYDDTPILPGTDWHVHDSNRPQPPVVTPGNLSTQPAVTPPSDAIVLFDGTNADAWQHAPDGRAVEWAVRDGFMEVVANTGGIATRDVFGDIQLHIEWAAPTVIEGDGQGRGNSGVFLMGRYEIQVLDCYENPTYADGSTAAIYGQFPPLANACCKPGEWHIYDILWECPRFEGEELVKPAVVTMLHNGVVVHNHRELLGGTTHRELPIQGAHPSKGPIELQDHGNPVRFRNIWVRDL